MGPIQRAGDRPPEFTFLLIDDLFVLVLAHIARLPHVDEDSVHADPDGLQGLNKALISCLVLLGIRRNRFRTSANLVVINGLFL